MSTAAGRLTLQRGQWFAFTMYPGYGDGPFHSPIRIDDLRPLGKRCFELTFLAPAYAAGVQDFCRCYHTLKRGDAFLLAEEQGTTDRLILVQPLTAPWLRAFLPHADEAMCEQMQAEGLR